MCFSLWSHQPPGPWSGRSRISNAIPEFAPEFLERRDQVGVAVALDRLCRRGERDRFGAGQRVGLRDVEDRHGAEEDALLARLLAVIVALLDRDGGEDLDRLLALADATAEREEGAEAGDVRGGDAAGMALDRDQPLVAEAVARETVGRADLDPALPALAGKQRARCLVQAVAVGLAARGALGVGERATVEATGHRRPP